MKAVYSYWEDNRRKLNGGFASKRDLAMTLALSVEKSLKQFKEVELVTNTTGKELLIDQYKLPFTNVRVVLDQFDYNLEPDFWAYVKIYAYSIQTEPFVHIDNDVILWDAIPKETLEAPLFFQNKEDFIKHTGYLKLIKEAKGFVKIDDEILSQTVQFALNCGVVGCNDLPIIQEWKAIVDEYLFHKRNQPIWEAIVDKHSHNHLFEQYFISALIAKKGTKVATLLKDDFMQSAYRDFKMTHLWGAAKRKIETMQRIRGRLFKDYPQYIERFSVAMAAEEVFDDIYRNELWGAGQGSGSGSSPEVTYEYRIFLKKFLKEYNIQSVVDFGCGDWQFSKLIDWDGLTYRGYDCVRSVVDLNNRLYGEANIDFQFANRIKDDCVGADLLILKDVLIHWPNKDVQNFLDTAKDLPYKYILITNQTLRDDLLNKDIRLGEFRQLDINSDPFNANVKEIFYWSSDNKTTYLIENK